MRVFRVLLIISTLLITSHVIPSKLDSATEITVDCEIQLTQYTDHNPIIICSDSDLEEQGWQGNGTLEEPYLIEGLNITSEEVCIILKNTTKHLIIQDMYLHLSSHGTTIISLSNITNVEIRNCYFSSKSEASHWDLFNSELNGYGVHGQSLTNVTIISNEFREILCGIIMEDSDSCHLKDNMITWELHSTLPYRIHGISFTNVNHSQVLNNTILHSITGISIINSNNNFILNNTVVSYHNGLRVRDGNHNWLYQNRIGWAMDYNGFDQGFANHWDDNISVGNAWSDYNETGQYDIGGDAGSG